MANFGFKGKQVQCLFTLYHADQGLSLTELCELCEEDKGAMSRTIKELTAQELLFVAEQDTQKYRNPIKLTEKGKNFAKIVTDKIASMFDAARQGITQTERDHLYTALARIADNLTKICKNYNTDN